MLYDVRHKVNIEGTIYPVGSTITSEQIGRQRTERALRNLNRIVPRKEQPAEMVSASTEKQAPAVSEPPRNKGGRPRTRTEVKGWCD